MARPLEQRWDDRVTRIYRVFEELRVDPKSQRGMIINVSEERLRIIAKARIDHAACLHILADPRKG